jgi:pyruvate kinase
MILATIGPTTCSNKNLKIISKYTNFLRLNGSHNSIAWHEKVSKEIRRINPKIKILLDIPGIKPRTLNKKNLPISENDNLIFYFKKKPSNKLRCIELSKPLPKIKKNSKIFSITDGKYNFKITKIKKDYIQGKSLDDFVLFPNQGLNVPHSIYDEKSQESAYLKFLKKAKNIKYDAIGLSFIQSKKMVKKIKSDLKNIEIVSKIENCLGLLNFKSIAMESNFIMIDRGDLTAEVGDTKLFSSILKISNFLKRQNLPLIIATGNLETMMSRSTPSKSEVFALGFYKHMKFDHIMLSEETAISKNWLRTIKWLNFFLSNSN